MIKIIHFVSSLDINSGVMNVIMNYYRYINKNEYQFSFIYFLDSEKTYEKEIITLGGEIYKISKPSFSLLWIKQLKEILSRDERYYRIFHNHEVYLSFILKNISRNMGIKRFIVHAHATKYSDKFMSSIRNKILCTPLRFMNYEKMACSKAAAQFLYRNASQAYILNNAVDIQKYKYDDKIRRNLRKIYNISDDTLVLGHIGRMVTQKNQIFLLKIFKDLIKSQNAVLMFIGDGILYDKIMEFVKQEELDKSIIFLKQRTDIDELLNIMDIFLLPSLYEGLPVVCVEAQANGLPCIISDNITEEVILTPICQQISLDLSINIWVKKIIELYKKSNTMTRNQGIKNIYNTSFNIRREVKRLEEYYSIME